MVMEAIWLSIQVFCQLKVNGNMGLFSIPCNPSGRLVFNEDILCSLPLGCTFTNNFYPVLLCAGVLGGRGSAQIYR